MAGFSRDEWCDRTMAAVDGLAAQIEHLTARVETVAAAVGLEPGAVFTSTSDALRDVRWRVEAVTRQPIYEAEEAARRAAQDAAARAAEAAEWRRIEESRQDLLDQLRRLAPTDPRRQFLHGMRPR
jgi:hypothetical protein